MFIYEKPIETEKDDFLGRTKFSKSLAQSIIAWDEKESLILSLYGEWGSGKSSVINLIKEHIEQQNLKERPTIIEFNPWLFSDEKSLTEHFFNEISKELEVKNSSKNDLQLAKKLRTYANLLKLTPEKTVLKSFYSKVFLALGLFGVTASQVTTWLGTKYDLLKKVSFVVGFLLISFEIIKESLFKSADFLEQKSKLSEKTVLEIKKEIRSELEKRNKKLLIILDDIDRLSTTEIRQILKLVKINADFPNTIYLLSFDRKIIEKNLEEQVGISGKDFLEKIVQVNFDIPLAKQEKIGRFLFKELDRVLANLPNSVDSFFDSNDPYWANVYNSGFKNFFKNIRDVKRYASGLDFNISQMYQGDVMEVNPIDFIAIEAIRIFAPEFYTFMKFNKEIFTSIDTEKDKRSDARKSEIEAELNDLDVNMKQNILDLIRRLFPQLDGVFQYGYSTYGYESQREWSRKLRICSVKNYDSYFTLIPGGDEEELSQYQLENIISKMDDVDELEEVLRNYLNEGKIRKVFERLQDFTNDYDKIPPDRVFNVVQALFNISDELPTERTGIWDIGADMDLMRIIYQLLKREDNKHINFKLLIEAIEHSKGLFGPIQEISLESPSEDRDGSENELVVPVDSIKELHKACINKIIEFKNNEKLLENSNLLYILYRWKEWDEKEAWKEFIIEIQRDDENILSFLQKFISTSRSITDGDYGYRKTTKFNYKSLGDFMVIENAKHILEKIKKENLSLYEKFKELIDVFLRDFDKRDKIGILD